MRCAAAIMATLLTILGLATANADDGEKLKVAVITGGHGFEQEPFLDVFRAQEDIAFKHIPLEKGEGFIDADVAGRYDVIVLYNMSATISEAHKQSLIDYIAGGGGLVVLHHAMVNYPDWPDWSEIIGARYFQEPTEWQGEERPKSKYTHDVQMPVHVEDPDHPITRGVADFVIHDETYRKWLLYPDNHLLLSCDHPESDKAVGWTRPYNGNEICYLQLGHGPEAFANPNFRTLVAQAVQWAAE